MALTMLQTSWKTEQELKHNIRAQEYSWRFSRGTFLLLNFANWSEAESSMETEKAQQIFWQNTGICPASSVRQPWDQTLKVSDLLFPVFLGRTWRYQSLSSLAQQKFHSYSRGRQVFQGSQQTRSQTASGPGSLTRALFRFCMLTHMHQHSAFPLGSRIIHLLNNVVSCSPAAQERMGKKLLTALAVSVSTTYSIPVHLISKSSSNVQLHSGTQEVADRIQKIMRPLVFQIRNKFFWLLESWAIKPPFPCQL